ncbi:hypothetical protein [Methylococcus sp. EFPC2]|uniref:hypothetical protein n=1 Tax=Methylococcus sp. EFPC2 TaxID=2812648 RepID=UPI001968221C|nr:hypothetical protein [Methylococcus sp. EFPC2]QSA97656.1 hypothetical protein JWZ97_02120 [Methylococcus sp. EFPC2]
MKTADMIAWAFLLLALAWMAHDRQAAYPSAECQDYDRIGNGLGCEGPDIGDR